MKFDWDAFEIGVNAMRVYNVVLEELVMLDDGCINNIVPANIIHTWKSEVESRSGPG